MPLTARRASCRWENIVKKFISILFAVADRNYSERGHNSRFHGSELIDRRLMTIEVRTSDANIIRRRLGTGLSGLSAVPATDLQAVLQQLGPVIGVDCKILTARQTEAFHILLQQCQMVGHMLHDNAPTEASIRATCELLLF